MAIKFLILVVTVAGAAFVTKPVPSANLSASGCDAPIILDRQTKVDSKDGACLPFRMMAYLVLNPDRVERNLTRDGELTMTSLVSNAEPPTAMGITFSEAPSRALSDVNTQIIKESILSLMHYRWSKRLRCSMFVTAKLRRESFFTWAAPTFSIWVRPVLPDQDRLKEHADWSLNTTSVNPTRACLNATDTTNLFSQSNTTLISSPPPELAKYVAIRKLRRAEMSSPDLHMRWTWFDEAFLDTDEVYLTAALAFFQIGALNLDDEARSTNFHIRLTLCRITIDVKRPHDLSWREILVGIRELMVQLREESGGFQSVLMQLMAGGEAGPVSVNVYIQRENTL